MTERKCNNCKGRDLWFARDGKTMFTDNPHYAVQCLDCKRVDTFEMDGVRTAYEIWHGRFGDELQVD